MVDMLETDGCYKQSPGKELFIAERLALQPLLANKFGYHALQLDATTGYSWLEDSLIPHKVFLSLNETFSSTSQVRADFTALPFAPDSIDLVLLPHVLEFTKQPQQILQEVYTVLIPEGYAIILCYNLLSLWGAARLFKQRQGYPWHGQFKTSFYLQHLLAKIGYWVVDFKTLFFRPPLASAVWQQRMTLFEGIGKLLWPHMGAVFLLLVQKRVAKPITISNKLFSKRLVVQPRAVQPTSTQFDQQQ